MNGRIEGQSGVLPAQREDALDLETLLLLVDAVDVAEVEAEEYRDGALGRPAGTVLDGFVVRQPKRSTAHTKLGRIDRRVGFDLFDDIDVVS